MASGGLPMIYGTNIVYNKLYDNSALAELLSLNYISVPHPLISDILDLVLFFIEQHNAMHTEAAVTGRDLGP